MGGAGTERSGHRSGLDGSQKLHRPRARQPGEHYVVLALRRAQDERGGGQEGIHRGGPRGGTARVECRKDKGVLDETPGACQAIEDVMPAQAELVEIVHTLRQGSASKAERSPQPPIGSFCR